MALRCEILVDGCFGPRLDGVLEGFEVVGFDEGRTRLVGVVADRSALRGLLARLDDFGIGLVAVDTRSVRDDSS